MTCEADWVEVGGEVGSHGSESDAAPALSLEAVYEDCCVVVVPDFGYVYDDVIVGSYSLLSYCGDACCDDGGCQDGRCSTLRSARSSSSIDHASGLVMISRGTSS